MIILSINISHKPSVCVYENNKIIEFYNEERFVVTKDYVLNSKLEIFQCILQKIKYKPDFVCYTSFGMNNQYFSYSDETNQYFTILKDFQANLFTWPVPMNLYSGDYKISLLTKGLKGNDDIIELASVDV